MLLLYILIIIFILLLTVLIFNIIFLKRSKFTYNGNSTLDDAYNFEKDIFNSIKNTCQKNFGYTKQYDIVAPLSKMNLDTEKVKFYYNNKNWLITFWKGQYEIVTGAEIGIYCTNDKKITKKTVYLPCDDSEMPHMYLTLYQKNKLIATINAKHWWLAIFNLGMFSYPNELSMDIVINFPTHVMLESFIESFKELGYQKEDYLTFDNTIYFKYIKPKTKQVWTRNFLIENINNYLNKNKVKLNNEFLTNLLEKDLIDKSPLNEEHISETLKNNKNYDETNKEIIEKLFNNNIGIIYENDNITLKKESIIE